MDWREIVKYPRCEGYGSLRGVEIMDALNQLIPFEPYGKMEGMDRIGKFSLWMREGKNQGLLTYSDESDIRQELIHGCGGC